MLNTSKINPILQMTISKKIMKNIWFKEKMIMTQTISFNPKIFLKTPIEMTLNYPF
jgi:hypothetical protein